MNEKLIAGIVTAAGVAPFCAVCVLGPAAIGSALAGIFAWLGGAGPLVTLTLIVAAGMLVYRTLRRRHQVNRTSGEGRRRPHLPTMENSKFGASRTVSRVWSAQQGERS